MNAGGLLGVLYAKKSIKITSFCCFFIVFFSLTVFVQLHCIAISLEMSSLCIYLQLWRSLNMLLCVPLHEWLSVLLKVFRGFSSCLIYFFFFGAFHCVMCAHVSTNTCTTKCQGTNTYAHIMIFGCTLTFRHSIPTYISRGVFLGVKFSSLGD